jgi:uncharacterized protein with HEPN domain
MLTNKEDGYFTISELEVWEVVNVENPVLKEELPKKGEGNCTNQ